jgi:hypothetical protein
LRPDGFSDAGDAGWKHEIVGQERDEHETFGPEN